MITYNKRQRCGTCNGTAPHVSCAKCNRPMCEDCVSVGEMGDECGLCVMREEGRHKWEQLKAKNFTNLPFEEWYDQYG